MGKRPPAGRRATAPPLTDEIAEWAMVLGMCVRNAMEGTIHGGELGDLSLTDEQMAVLNPIVRNAIATALHAEEHYFTDKASKAYLDFQRRLVPTYWQRPVLLDDYTELWPFFASRDDEPDPTCRRCGRAVVNVGSDERSRWTHVAADGGLNVGCRAASFTTEGGWDDDLPRSWKAAPVRDS
jgi:hypothetical protein